MQKAFPVSWDQFHRDARALAWRLSAAGPFRAVVAVTRGGLVPAAVVARELGIRVVETVCVASYDYDKQGEISILKNVASDISGDDKGKGVLYDYRVAAKFLRMAADQGNLDAQVYLGVKYNHGVRGEAVKEDEENYGSLA